MNMDKIQLGNHIFLTKSIIKVLAQNRITTSIEFIQEDPEKLSVLTKLSFSQILEIRTDIFNKYCAPLIRSSTVFKRNSRCTKYLSTGIESLDAIMETGVPVGFITEVCGLAGSGKSQLCMQFAINCVKCSDSTVLYIDTKGDFSAVRIQKVLETFGISHRDMATIMVKIQVVHVWYMEDLIKLLEQIKKGIIKIDNLSLIIVDSLPCLQLQHFGDNNKIGLVYINKIVNLSRCLSKELEIGFVYVNIQTRWIDEDIPDIDAEEESTYKKDSTYTEKRNRCLGKYWQTIPAVLLLIEKNELIAPNKDVTIKVTITKNINPFMTKTCEVKINKLGVN